MNRNQGEAWARQQVEKMNQMSGKEFVEKAKEAIIYCKANNLLIKEDVSQPNKVKAARKAIMLMEMHKQNHQEQPK